MKTRTLMRRAATVFLLAAVAGCSSNAPRAGGDGPKAVAVERHAADAGAEPKEADPMPLFVYFIHPTRSAMIEEGMRDDERARIAEHFTYLKDLTERGVVLLAGPTTASPYTGIVVFRGEDQKAATRIMQNDPAVQAGVFEARVAPFNASLVGDWSEAGTG